MELRRPLTAAAASSLLVALTFVPSASAADDEPSQVQRAAATSQSSSRTISETPDGAAVSTDAADTGTGRTDSDLNLADTGSIDTDPYLWGGTAFIGVGAILVLFARRRQFGDL
ncbi:hypothetical protein AQ490_09320 [Wenjunlia vitaminophila]|uniref:LPXTG cell wall anchor domain-containing protein n=1 Tax=Wenjunlia vitaminophila TaxID=76728 RepID=A0A0T6LLG5_WENVI|nr:LPXTG cell wall anchor domain-containing protein [Wenjunlia vitaminophila]KRV46955.1 hypothetical protein AQ490_09320 [Wenjunlia vitaminophila]